LLIRGTEDAEDINFSIAVERTAIEKQSAAYAAQVTKMHQSFGCNVPLPASLLPVGLSGFIQSPSQRLDKKITNSAICGSAVIINYPRQ
jgi:hypothetical protein